MLTQTLNREKKEKTKTVRHKFKSDAYPNIKQRKKKGREANFHHHSLKTHHHGENPNIKQRKKRKKKKKTKKEKMRNTFGYLWKKLRKRSVVGA